MKTATDWRHWTVLAVLLLALAAVGVRNIGRHSLWLDEYWDVYTATGRGGDQLLKIPVGQVLNPPPELGFKNAPSWPHIWTSLNFTSHPPFHFIFLRGWIWLFGDSDRAVRLKSLVFSLAGMVLLFDTLRRKRDPWAALIGVGLMAASVPEIDLSSETRSYTFAVFIGLICCRLILDIEEHGAKLWRIIALSISLLLFCLTHYLAIAPAAAIALYGAVRLRGSDRKWTLVAIGVTGIVFLAAWGPMMPGQRGIFGVLEQSLTRPPFVTLEMVAQNFLFAPQVLLFWQYPVNVAATLLLVGLFFVAPLAGRLRRDDLLWWMWGLSVLVLAASDDLLHLNHRRAMGGIPRYIFLASPAVFALMKPIETPWLCRFMAPIAVLALFSDPGSGLGNSHVGDRIWLTAQQIGVVGIVALCIVTSLVSLPKSAWFGVAAVTFLATMAAIGRFGGDDTQAENWQPNRELAAEIQTSLQPSDLLIFSHSGEYGNFWSYFVFQHYTHDEDHAVMFADSPSAPHPPPNATEGFKRAVLITPDANSALLDFPGWHVVSTSPRIGADIVARLQR